jgi:hypothetical protein
MEEMAFCILKVPQCALHQNSQHAFLFHCNTPTLLPLAPAEYMRYTFKVTCDFFKPDASQGALYDTVLYVRDAAVKAAMVRSGVKVEHSKLHEAMGE